MNEILDILASLQEQLENAVLVIRCIREEHGTQDVVTREQLLAALMAKKAEGHVAEVKALLKKYGAAKLSEVDPAHYADMLRDAQGIGGGP